MLWSTNTAGHPGSQLDMRADGNLVLNAPGWVPLWSTNTGGHPGAKLEVLDTGNLVVVASDGTILWSSNSTNDRLMAGDELTVSNVGACFCVTSADGHYMIQMGLDGNLSLGVTGGGAIWSTAPSGVQGDIGFMLDTGWFRIEGYAGIVDWSTPTSAGARRLPPSARRRASRTQDRQRHPRVDRPLSPRRNCSPRQTGPEGHSAPRATRTAPRLLRGGVSHLRSGAGAP